MMMMDKRLEQERIKRRKEIGKAGWRNNGLKGPTSFLENADLG